MGDPLDYLNKYCIIHPHRLPAYELAFRRAVARQKHRYTELNEAAATATVDAGGNDAAGNDVVEPIGDLDQLYHMQMEAVSTQQLTEKDRDKMCRRLQGDAATYMRQEGDNIGDKNVKKLRFIISNLNSQTEELELELEELEEMRKSMTASIIREKYPEAIYSKRRGKKNPMSEEDRRRMRKDMAEYSDEGILDLAGKKLVSTQVPSVAKVSNRIRRIRQKLSDLYKRSASAHEEFDQILVFSQDLHFAEQVQNIKPENFKREQSIIYQRLNPEVDVELNITEMESALTSINGQLLTKNEYKFVYHVLNLPTRSRVNVKLFSVVAALSEKVSQLEPIVRKLINKFDYESLEHKMDKCKELFYLLDEKDDFCPKGSISVHSLVVELLAGGLTHEHVQQVVGKFNREHKGFIEFLDYLTYVPLFVEIHGRICENPLNNTQQW